MIETNDVAPAAAPILSPAEAARMGGRIAWLAGLAVVAIPLHFVWRLVRARSPWPQRFLGAAARACGVRVTTVGTPVRHDVVFVANHVSWLDILALGGTTWLRFVAQDAIEEWPLIGWLADLNATIYVSRTDRAGIEGQVELIRGAVAGAQPVAIFPEGTTTDGRDLLPFKPALFAALVPPPRPLTVQPVALEFDDRGAELAWIGTEGAGPNARRVLGNPGTVALTIRFLEPFPTAGLDRKAIAGTARARIAAALTAHAGHPVA